MNKRFLEEALEKLEDKNNISDVEDLEMERSDSGAFIMGKRYQGAQRLVREFILMNTLAGRSLNRSEINLNYEIGKELVIVETFFGRLLTLWAISSKRFKCSQKVYDEFIIVCAALKN